MLFVCFSVFFSCTHGVPARCAFEEYIVRISVLSEFNLDAVFNVLLEIDCPFRCIRDCGFPLPGGATIFAKLR